jgi:signal transduction histidine kinase
MTSNQWSDREFGALPSVVVAAHELKTPLALMRQLSLLLSEGSLDGAETRRVSQQVTQTAERALALVGDLAHTANLSPTLFPLEPVNPLAVCRQIAQDMRPALQVYDRRVEWPRGRQAQLVVANQTLLGRVLANFLENALRYSEPSATVRVKLQRRGDVLRMGVRDFGPMMSLREYRQLLDEMALRKSIRTRPESSGLGVYVASQFAQAMNGEIGLIRHRDGLTFYVDVPLSRQMSWL